MKKQIAVLMAAATAVTTVAPVLANAEVKEKNNVSLADLNKAIKEALDTRYKDDKQDGIKNNSTKKVDEYLNSRYAIFISVGGKKIEAPYYNDYVGEGKAVLNAMPAEYNDVDFDGVDKQNVSVVIDAKKTGDLLEKLLVDDKDVKVYVVDKGIDEKTGLATFESNNKQYKKDNSADEENFVKLSELKAQLDDLANKTPGLIKKDSISSTPDEVKFELESGKKLVFVEDDEVIDLTKGLDKDGNKIPVVSVSEDILKTVVDFEKVERTDDKTNEIDIKFGDTVVYSLNKVEKVEVSNVYSEETGYTDKGADFVNKLIKVKKDDKNKFTFNHDGASYTLAKDKKPVKTPDEAAKAIHTDSAKIEKDGDKYVLRINVDVVDANDNDIAKTLQFVIEGKSQKDLARVLNDIDKNVEAIVGRFKKLAGSNRYATAIEISKERFSKKDGKDIKADTVVIVGGNAVIDGLSAGPLAAVKNAPILLADAKSGLNNDTLNEIDRVCENLKNKTVYIVGGDSSVPKSVEKQLKDKFGVVVVRISGKDRFETSLDVARRLKYDKQLNNGKAYIVGKEGAPDAMSIAGVAATSNDPGAGVFESVNPVIVVPKDDVSRKTRDFITQGFDKKYIIGGEGTVSTNVFKLLKADKRVSGKNRYETNVEILKEFYGEQGIEVGGAIFVSGKTDYLVDAQTSAVLSGNKKAPIVLTDNKLTDSQIDLLNKKKKGLLSGVKENVYQIGGVVSADVMKVVVKELGL